MHRRSKRILTALGILIVALAVTYAILLARSTVKLRRAYAALAADGRPMRTAEIIPPKVPDAENAAVLYQSAILVLKGEPVGDKSLFERLTAHIPGSRKPDETKELLEREAVARALSLIEQGARRPACQLEHNYVDSLRRFNAPEVEDMRVIVFLTRARARWEAEAGHPDKAWDLVLTLLRFGDSLRCDPVYEAQYVRLSAVLVACRTIQWLCETAPPDRERAQAIEDLLKRQDNIDLLIRAVDAERLLIGESFFNVPKEELDRTLWKQRSNDKITPPGLLRAIHRLSFTILACKPRLIADHAAYLQLMKKRVQLLQGPYRDRKETGPLLQPSLWNILTCELTSASGHDKWIYCRDMADLRVTRAGLALLQYRQTHGAFPKTLEALGLEGLVDPFAEKPLPYRADGGGFVVYSIGDDLKDNGGAPRPQYQESDPRRKPAEYDQLWRFPNPENRAATGAR